MAAQGRRTSVGILPARPLAAVTSLSSRCTRLSFGRFAHAGTRYMTTRSFGSVTQRIEEGPTCVLAVFPDRPEDAARPVVADGSTVERIARHGGDTPSAVGDRLGRA